MTNNPYRYLGIGFILSGAIFAPVAYFLINSSPLTAIALSAIMIGFTSFALSTSRPQISPEASQMILETGMENVAALIEELGLKSKAIYLPASMRTGNAQALIPLNGDIDVSRLKGRLPKRLIVRYGDNPADMAIAVTAPGGTSLINLQIKPSNISSEIEQAVTYVLTGFLDIADSVEIRINGNRLDVDVRGARLHYENVWYYQCMGSPIASIVASITSNSLEKPVRIISEHFHKGINSVSLEVLGENL